MRSKRVVALSVVALVVAGCGPQLAIVNSTSSEVRIRVTASGDTTVFPIEANGSDALDMSLESYTVQVLDDAKWTAAMEQARDGLVAKLADPSSMTPAQIADAVAQLADIQATVDKLAQAGGAACSGRITSKNDGQATIAGSGPNVTISCSDIPVDNPPAFDFYPFF